MAPKTSILLWKDIHEIANKACREFGLTYGQIVPEIRKQARHYGEARPCDKCFNAGHIDERNCSEKALYIRIHQLNKPTKPLAPSTILDTLAHELAHLRIWRHTPEHRVFVREIKDYIVSLGYEL